MSTMKRTKRNHRTEAEAVKAFRREHHLSQRQLAELLGTTVQTISGLERGARQMGNPVLWAWALDGLAVALLSGDIAPPRMSPGTKVSYEVREWEAETLRGIVEAHPDITLRDIARLWKRLTGDRRSIAFFSRRLKAAGIVRRRSEWVFLPDRVA